MGFQKMWALGALLLAGCGPRSEGVATAAWADDGSSFLAVVLSYQPTHTMFGIREGRADVRAHFVEQVPGLTGQTQVGPDAATDVLGPSYYVKSAGYFVYFAGGFDPANSAQSEQGAWVERAVPGGGETVVAAPSERPAGCHETQVVPSRDGKHLAVLHARCDAGLECKLEIKARDTRTAVFSHRWTCDGWGLAWQPNGDLWVDGAFSSGSLRVLAPSWSVAPPDTSAPYCPLPTNCGSTDDRGRMLQYSPVATDITVLETEKVTACAP